jgi:Domain of unknown function (DUF1918)
VTVTHTQARARAGDWLEVHGPAAKRSQRGQITEVLGCPGHEHYRVRWDEKHESIHYPAGGTVILPRPAWRSERAPSK